MNRLVFRTQSLTGNRANGNARTAVGLGASGRARPKCEEAEGLGGECRPDLQATNVLRDTRGANLVEYIILVGVVALIAIAGFKTFGSRITEKVQQQSDAIGAINGSTN